MKVLLIGHSHTIAIHSVITQADGPRDTYVATHEFELAHLKLDPFHGLFRDSNSRMTRHALALKERLVSAQAVVMCLEGSWHNNLGMIERSPKYDFFGETGSMKVDESRQLLPRNVLSKVFIQRMESPMRSPEGVLRASFLDVLTFIRECVKCPCVLVEPPPPMPDAGKIAKFRPLVTRGEHGVTPYGIRIKLWQLQSSLLRKYCDRVCVDFLPAPKEVFDARGNLDPRAYEGVEDPTHMGPWYGHFVLNDIGMWLERQPNRVD